MSGGTAQQQLDAILNLVNTGAFFLEDIRLCYRPFNRYLRIQPSRYGPVTASEYLDVPHMAIGRGVSLAYVLEKRYETQYILTEEKERAISQAMRQNYGCVAFCSMEHLRACLKKFVEHPPNLPFWKMTCHPNCVDLTNAEQTVRYYAAENLYEAIDYLCFPWNVMVAYSGDKSFYIVIDDDGRDVILNIVEMSEKDILALKHEPVLLNQSACDLESELPAESSE